MKKRFIALLLAVVLVISLLPAPALAMPAPYERLEAVDYSRIPGNGVLQRRVELQIGSKRFIGRLMLGKTLTHDEEDKIIRDVMNEMGITSGMLIRAKYIIKKVEQNTGFDMDFVQQLGLKFAFGAFGIDNIQDIYAVLKGEQDVASTSANMVLGSAISGVAKHAYGGVASLAVSGLFSCTELMGQKVAQVIRESEEAQEALEKTVMLNMFYDQCRARIAKAVLEKGKGSWMIEIDTSCNGEATLFDIPVTQHWYVSCKLYREDTYGDREDLSNYSGIYRGDMTIEISHDLRQFDKQFLEAARQYKLISQLEAIGCPTTERRDTASTLTKTLRNTSTVEVHLNTANLINGSMSEFISLKDFEDESAFHVDHLIRQGHPHEWWDENGHLDMTIQSEQGPVRVESNFYYEHLITGLMQEGNRYPALQAGAFGAFADETIHFPLLPYLELVNINQEVGLPFLTDYQIYNDLRPGGAKLTINPR